MIQKLIKIINKQKLSVNTLIKILKRYKDYDLIFYSDYMDLVEFPITLIEINDDDTLLDIYIDCYYPNKNKNTIKCSSLIKKLKDIQKQYNHNLYININIIDDSCMYEMDIQDIFIENNEIQVFLSLTYRTMLYD